MIVEIITYNPNFSLIILQFIIQEINNACKLKKNCTFIVQNIVFKHDMTISFWI
jgi:hypothetical protein